MGATTEPTRGNGTFVRRAEPPLRVLPRGRHAAPREVVAESQRERMLVAVAEAVAEKGYANTAVADIISRAGVSRRSFYEHFSNKEDCFLAAYDAGVSGLLEEIAAAEESAGADLVARARAGTETYLELLSDNPAFARTFLIEVLGAGPDALARREVVHQRFAERFAKGYERARERFPDLPEVPEHVFRATVGAVHELVTRHLLEHDAATLPTLLDQILEVELRLLVPFGPGRD
jgi:AcrR family transcriptional regulator